MELLAKCISGWLYRSDVIKEEEIELYEYAVSTTVITLLPLLFCTIYGMITSRLLEDILLIIPFMCMRRYSGGYHARHAWTCMVSSVVVLVFCMYTVAGMSHSILHTIAIVIASVSLYINSPIDNANRELDEEERAYCKNKVRRWLVIFLLLYVLFRVMSLADYCVSISIGIVLVAMLQIPCIGLKKRYL